MSDATANQEGNVSASGDAWSPEDVPQLTVDVYRKSNTIFVVSTVAGVDGKDLDITVDGKNLTIKGSRKKPYAKDQELLLNECFWGEFSRELTINENIDVDKISASLKNGILTVEVPLLIIAAHKRIPVSVE